MFDARLLCDLEEPPGIGKLNFFGPQCAEKGMRMGYRPQRKLFAQVVDSEPQEQERNLVFAAREEESMSPLEKEVSRDLI